jgi:hypothetical protein
VYRPRFTFGDTASVTAERHLKMTGRSRDAGRESEQVLQIHRNAAAAVFSFSGLTPFTLCAQDWSGFHTHKFPAAALSSKTVAIVNDTHTKGVTEGAVEEFRDGVTCASSPIRRTRTS